MDDTAMRHDARSPWRLARIELGAATWPGDLDLAPEAMYQAVKEQGMWIVD